MCDLNPTMVMPAIFLLIFIICIVAPIIIIMVKACIAIAKS